MAGTALVTGASRGIGREVARELAREGRRVIATERARAGDLPGAMMEDLDVGSRESIAALAERLRNRGERLEILVNNAGVYRGVPPPELWDVNVRGPLLLTLALESLLVDGARVVMVSSGLGSKRSQDRAFNARLAAISTLEDMQALCDEAPGGYGASKAALNRLSELFAERLRSRNILVNAVSPGWVRTDMGGPSAPRSLRQGASSVLWACHLDANGPTGGFFEDGKVLQ